MRGAHPERRLEALVAESLTLGPGETLLVACSGGPDSVALGALAARAAEAAGAVVVLGHVNHGLRPGAWQDEGVVAALGAALGLRTLSVGVEPGGSDEAALREARYPALAALARAAGAARIATAHHARDQAETVLMALFRGTGPDGLAGMPPARPLEDGLTLVRPLLRVDPADLLAYCRSEHLPYARDPSNADPAYRRNAVRAALDLLRETYPHLDEAVARCAELVRDERGGTPRARLREGLRAAIAAGGTLDDVTMERVDAAVSLIERGGTGRVHLGPGVEVRVERG
jgi:tRNA(Ile)-lysidine synthase